MSKVKRVNRTEGAHASDVIKVAPTIISAAWWPAPPQNLDPLQAVDIVADHLERDEGAPQPAGRVVAAALRGYLTGGDFNDALGLRTKHGKRRAVTQAITAARDAKLREAFERMGGGPRTARAAELADALHGRGEVPAGCVAIIRELRRDHRRLPRSGRQLLRIVGIG